MPEEIIYTYDELANEMYFIEEGIINLKKIEKDNVIEEYVLTKGDHFGEMAILTHWKSDCDAYAMVFCIL